MLLSYDTNASLYEEVSCALSEAESDNLAVLMNVTMADESVLVSFNNLTNAPYEGEPFSSNYQCNYTHLDQIMKVEPEEPTPDSWKTKPIYEWSEWDAMQWIICTAQSNGYSAAEIPTYLFQNTTGQNLMRMSRDSFLSYMQYATLDRSLAINVADLLYQSLHERITSDTSYAQGYDEAVVPKTVIDKFDPEFDSFNDQDSRIFLDLDKTQQERLPTWDSDYDSSIPEDSVIHFADHDSPPSKPCSESDSERSIPNATPSKRKPGRPPGSGKKIHKRVKNVSVPEFLRDLLLNPKYCPKIIKWEDYSIGKFRFVRADEVARLWGGKRNNSKMSFEKFSRAMRYHYKQHVLESVPTARLVYQFGQNGPKYQTDDPNFEAANGSGGS